MRFRLSLRTPFLPAYCLPVSVPNAPAPPLLHPASHLLLFFAAALAVQAVAAENLLALAGLMGAGGLAVGGLPAWRRGLRLIWRTRWLLVSLGGVFAFGVPGEAWWSGWPAPTDSGVAQAGEHLLRLILMLHAVALLLEVTPRPRLLSGCYVLLAPLRRLGVDVGSGVVRLMLVLHYAETLPPMRAWQGLLREEPPVSGPWTLRLELPGASWRDVVALAGMAAVLGCLGAA